MAPRPSAAPTMGSAARVVIRCTSPLGDTALLGIPVGRGATWKIEGHPWVTVGASPTSNGLLVTLAVAKSDNGALSPLGKVLLKANVKTPMPKPDVSGIAAMEWTRTVQPGAAVAQRTPQTR
jgi:hypothetical protein